MTIAGVDSAQPPNSATVAQAVREGYRWWGFYIGGAGAAKIWSAQQSAVLQAGGMKGLPIWVPKLDLSEDPNDQADKALATAQHHGISNVIALDTEHVQITQPHLKSFVDAFTARLANKDTIPVVYCGAGYCPASAYQWAPHWGTKTPPPPSAAFQIAGNQSKWKMTVDLNSAGDTFPLGEWGNRKVPTVADAIATLAKPIIGIAIRPQNDGYWLLGADGGIFCFGQAQEFGNLVGKQLNRPPVAFASSPSGDGYYIVCSDGGVDCFGDAQFFGALPGTIAPYPVITSLNI